MKIDITKTLEVRLSALAAMTRGQTAKRIAINALRRGLRQLEGQSRYAGFLPKEQHILCLTEADKKLIEKNPHLLAIELSPKLQKPVAAVLHYRLTLAKRRIETHLGAEKDAVVAAETGLTLSAVSKLRVGLGYKHPVGGQKERSKEGKVIAKLGGTDAIRFALTEGGETIHSLIRKKDVRFTRERGRQVLGSVGITGDRDLRKPIWYALRLFEEGREDRQELAQKFTDEKWLTQELATAGGLSALARKYGTTVGRLRGYVRERFPDIDKTLILSHGEVVEFQCDSCGAPVFIEKRMVKLRPTRLHFCRNLCRDDFAKKSGGIRSWKNQGR